ncbi:hypothetical protein NEOLEDRAFT_1157046 [Neolentinus lepideus HHB14362 ss-1]|uniref:G-patch domain-containing protein n=1 Tax=Neolentinus lepideus HHB14362 ss-1 TaxID=1314782 RepID=A0A165RJR4_9AGAM|nr:hypothetical protein NEOLEDRAFT_1157046 [Neolentinus lepideus HHB14362 ss-1]
MSDPRRFSFTVRRPTPISRNSSEPDSDSSSFKIPALPRHLAANQSAPGSPLARSANASPRPNTRTYQERDSSDEEDEEIQDVLVTGFDQFGVQRLHEKKKPEGPLVIPALKNRDWREFAKKRKGASMYVPASAQATTGADGSVGGLGTRDTINSGPQKMGLQVKQKKIKMEADDETTQVTTTEVDVKMEEDGVKEEDEDQRALRAILASVKGEDADDGPTIEAIRPVSEDDAYKQDVAELPDEATPADYERIPVSQFGAAMLRGMGWKEGQAASRKQKGPVEPWLPQSRPALLGIGAKERVALDDGSGKKKKAGKATAMKYVPVVKKEREASVGDGRPSSRKGSSSGEDRHRDWDDRRRDHERDRDRDRDYDRDRSDRRDRDEYRRRDGRRDFDRSASDHGRDDDRRKRTDRRDD